MFQALREILAVFKVNDRPLKKGIEDSSKRVDGLASKLKGLAGPLLAAFSGAAVIGFTRSLMSSADATASMADALGLGIAELQGWQHAADLSSVDTALLTQSLGRLQLQLSKVATEGKGPAAQALRELGIEAMGADGALKRTSEVLEEVADAVHGMDAAERNVHLMRLFGEQGAKLAPLLKGGSASLREMRAEVEELGFAFDDAFAASSSEFGSNLDRLSKAGKGLMIQVLGPMLPGMVKLSNAFVRAAKAVTPLVRELVGFLRQTKLLQAALTLLTGKGLLVGVRLFGQWAKAAGGLTGVLKGLMRVLFRFIAPLLILEDAIVFLTGGKSKLGEILDDAFGEGTSDKVSELAGKVGDFVKMFVEAPGMVRDAFADLPNDLETILGPFGAFLGELVQDGVDGVLWMVNIMTGGWQNFGDKVTALGEYLMGFLRLVWNDIQGAALAAASAVADSFSGAWNSIIDGAKRALKVISEVVSKVPLIGRWASRGVESAADGLDDMRVDTGRAEAVRQQAQAARTAILSDIDAASARMSGSSERGPAATNYSVPTPGANTVSQEVNNSTVVNVSVPPGTPASVANRVGQEARRGAAQGSARNLRATQDALVPRPAG